MLRCFDQAVGMLILDQQWFDIVRSNTYTSWHQFCWTQALGLPEQELHLVSLHSFPAYQPLEVLLPGVPATSIPGPASPLAELWTEDEESGTSGTPTPSSKRADFLFIENPPVNPCQYCHCYVTLFNISVTIYKSHKNNRSTLNTKERGSMAAKDYLFKVNFRCRHESWCKESGECPQPVCQISQHFTIWS